MAIKKVTKSQAPVSSPSLLDRMESEVQSNQSKVSMVLGGLIVLVVGILIFNYFNKPSNNKPEITPAAEQTTQNNDVSPEKLPGKYTVKDGDTLFLIAQKYYQDGYKFEEIAKANNLTSVDVITTGQVLEIPKLAITNAPEPAAPVVTATPAPEAAQAPTPVVSADKGGVVAMGYGEPINGNTYTVVEGDWLSTIAARAYGGDIMAYSKLAAANNITNPDLIEPGMVLAIPR